MLSRIFISIIVITIFLISSCSYDRYALRYYKRAQRDAPYDVIIVPGVPYEDTSMNRIFQARVLWAKFLYEHHIAKNIIFSGSAVYTPYMEGKVMRIFADSLGIPSANTFSETKAEHSVENVYYSVRLAKTLGFKKIAVATDPFQTKMLRSFIRVRYPKVGKIPAVFDSIRTSEAAWPKINPSSARVDNFISLLKREKKWKRLKGTLGRNIDFKQKNSDYTF